MAKRSKRYRAAAAKIERTRRYSLEEAVRTIAAGDGPAKFDETVELAAKLGVDPRQADQNVRGTVVLPHGTGKSVRVLVLAKGGKAREATEAGKGECRGEKAGRVHVPIGTRSFGTERGLENAHALLTSLLRAKPAAAKGNYLQSVALSTTMGPAVRIDPVAVRATA